jgi:putative endonuclease
VFYVYIVASGRNGTIYTGGTDDIRVRIENHRAKRFGGFTAKYGVAKLVWYETHPSREQAFRRERQIKEWRRIWKLQLIEARNPNWVDLIPDIDRLLIEDEVRALNAFLPGSRRSPG